MEFITNRIEFEAAKEQVADYVISGGGTVEDDRRIDLLIDEMERYVLRETGMPLTVSLTRVN